MVDAVADYYAQKLSTHGQTARGVDWSSDASQQLRFDELLRVTAGEESFTLLDYGCGYGALAQRLIAGEGRDFHYYGFDVCAPMIDAARGAIDDPRCTFTDDPGELREVDYALASGIFNVRLRADEARWHAYIADTLATLARHSRRGFAFNMLTRYADVPLMRDYLYYADPARYFHLCKERFSRQVALLHDYELFEFTILVRMTGKEEGPGSSANPPDSEPKALAP